MIAFEGGKLEINLPRDGDMSYVSKFSRFYCMDDAEIRQYYYGKPDYMDLWRKAIQSAKNEEQDLSRIATEGDFWLLTDLGYNYLKSNEMLPTHQEMHEYVSTFRHDIKLCYTVNTWSRQRTNRNLAFQHHGRMCKLCKNDCLGMYGKTGQDLLIIHHVNELSIHGEDAVKSINDLLPLCPNCHAFVHTTHPCMKIEDAKKLIRVLM